MPMAGGRPRGHRRRGDGGRASRRGGPALRRPDGRVWSSTVRSPAPRRCCSTSGWS